VRWLQGFKVDKLPKHVCYGIRPLDLDAPFFKPNMTGRDYMEIMANVAIDKYNQVEASTTTTTTTTTTLFSFFLCHHYIFPISRGYMKLVYFIVE